MYNNEPTQCLKNVLNEACNMIMSWRTVSKTFEKMSSLKIKNKSDKVMVRKKNTKLNNQ